MNKKDELNKYRKYTEAEDNYLRDNVKIKIISQLAEELNRTKISIKNRMRVLKIRKFKKWNKVDDDYLINNFRNKTLENLSQEFGATKIAIEGRLKVLELKKRDEEYFNSLIDKKYGQLTIKKRIKVDGAPDIYLCQCDCGNFYKSELWPLKVGRAKRCQACAHQDIGRKNFKGFGSISLSYFNRVKRNALNRDLEFSIEMTCKLWDSLFEKQNRKCALSGMLLVPPSGYLDSETTASLDRIDSSKGYIIGNIRWVHKDINLIKQNLSDDYFNNLCRMVAEYSKLKINNDSNL